LRAMAQSSPEWKKKFEYHIVVLGSGGVGKSCMTLRLVTGNFSEEYDSTIVDNYRKEVNIDGETALLEILDTAGQEEFKTMRDQWIKDGEGFLLLYSITEPITFEEVPMLTRRLCGGTTKPCQ